jgi:hypothetical protein
MISTDIPCVERQTRILSELGRSWCTSAWISKRVGLSSQPAQVTSDLRRLAKKGLVELIVVKHCSPSIIYGYAKTASQNLVIARKARSGET